MIATPTTTAAPTNSAPAFYVGIGLASNLVPISPYKTPLGLGLLAQFGINFSDSLSLRFSADFSESPSYGTNLILKLGGGFYTGIDAGLVVGNGFYAGGILGFSFDLAQNFALFLEANPRFTFGNPSFGVKTALGVRLGL